MKIEEQENFDFNFECEQCTESWSENLLNLIDKCSTKELMNLLRYIQKKLDE
jgi:hypothetical protein